MSEAVVSEIPGAATYEPDEWTRRFSLRCILFSIGYFLLAGSFAMTMRTQQAGPPVASFQEFYALMTGHGILMFLGWMHFLIMGLTYYLVPRQLGRPLHSRRVAGLSFWLGNAGILGVVLAVSMGFGAGWYWLMPLPFYPAKAWSMMAAMVFFIAIMFALLSILIFGLEIFMTVLGGRSDVSSLSKLSSAFGFDALFGSNGFSLSFFAVASLVNLFIMILATPGPVIVALMGIYKLVHPSFAIDYLLAKNLFWFWGHPIVYYALFPFVGLYYELFPVFAKRPLFSYRMGKAVWPLLLIFVILVFPHHIYQDVPQPMLMLLIAQFGSLMIAAPSGMTVFNIFATMWGSKYDWNVTAKFFLLSILGWILGGFPGVILGIVGWDTLLHNTLFVVGHFHFNLLVGATAAGMGTIYWLLPQLTKKRIHSETLADLHFWTTAIGSIGFATILMIAGLEGAPRREAQLAASYQFDMSLALFFVTILAIGQLAFVYNVVKTLRNEPSS